MAQQPRPIKLMEEIGRKFPMAWKKIAEFKRAPPVPWPDWCFLPAEAFFSIASKHLGMKFREFSVEATFDAQKLAALGIWRYTKGVYRIDPAVIEHIAKTTIWGLYLLVAGADLRLAGGVLRSSVAF